MASKFIIYGLFDPRDGQLRYIGKSTSGLKRARAHGAAWSLSKDPNGHKANWIRQLQAASLTYEIEVLEEHQTAEELPEAEIWNIAYFRSLGCRLTNATDGGEGRLGCRHSLSARAKMSEDRRAAMTQSKREQLSLLWIGVRKSDETKRKMSRAQQNMTPQHRAKISAAKKGRGGKPIVDQNGVWYPSGKAAAAALGLHQGTVSKVVTGKLRHDHGYVFRYAI